MFHNVRTFSIKLKSIPSEEWYEKHGNPYFSTLTNTQWLFLSARALDIHFPVTPFLANYIFPVFPLVEVA